MTCPGERCRTRTLAPAIRSSAKATNPHVPTAGTLSNEANPFDPTSLIVNETVPLGSLKVNSFDAKIIRDLGTLTRPRYPDFGNHRVS